MCILLSKRSSESRDFLHFTYAGNNSFSLSNLIVSGSLEVLLVVVALLRCSVVRTLLLFEVQWDSFFKRHKLLALTLECLLDDPVAESTLQICLEEEGSLRRVVIKLFQQPAC